MTVPEHPAAAEGRLHILPGVTGGLVGDRLVEERLMVGLCLRCGGPPPTEDEMGEWGGYPLCPACISPQPSPDGGPVTFTHPDVFWDGVKQGWAEAETNPARIDWPTRQAAAAIPFEVVDGRPVNPCEKTKVRYGRNQMGFWGENLMADALVTVTINGARYVLMVERDDGYGRAVPGGHVDPGEPGTTAAVRELAEETGLDAKGWPSAVFREMPPRYVPDPRASGEAWTVTVPVHIDLGTHGTLPVVTGASDARRADWVPASCYMELVDMLFWRCGGKVFTAHVEMLREFLG